MSKPLPTAVRVLLAACLAAACGASLAAAPDGEQDPITALSSAYTRAVTPGEQADMYRGLIGTVLQRVQRAYALEVDLPSLISSALKTIESVKDGSGDPAAVFKTAINAALASLDPHSRYLDARERREQRSALSGSFAGLGIQVDMAEGLVRVIAPMEDTPASRAGLRSGDLIVRFDDQPVLGMTLADAVARMRGEPGTPIILLIRRPGRDDEFTVSLVRDTIRSQILRRSMEDNVLVLRLASFTGSAASLVEKAIAEATTRQTPRAVILDMRGNPGGSFNQALAIADAFLSQGEIVSLRGRTPGNRRAWNADPAEQLAGVPMVVLLDGRSASAAELVAAALQDNGRALVMGQRSYGKGSVQSILSLGGERGALSLTTALYHAPSGRAVQRTGVGPDIELVSSEGTSAARGGRREGDRTRALPGVDEPAAPRLRVEQARCPRPQSRTDEALACALAFLKAGATEAFLAALSPAESSATP